MGSKVEKLPLIDENGKLSGLVTIKDIEKVLSIQTLQGIRTAGFFVQPLWV